MNASKSYIPVRSMNRIAVVAQSDEVANVFFPGGDRLIAVNSLKPKEGNNMQKTESVYDLSDEDHEFINQLTGNGAHERENVDKFGLSVMDTLDKKGVRSMIEQLSFDAINHQDEILAWLRKEFKTFQPYAEKLVGKKGFRKLLKAIKKAKSNPTKGRDLTIENVLGLNKVQNDNDNWKPGKASYDEHRTPEGNHRADDGRMPDEVEGKWKKNDDGSWGTNGFVIPYLRKQVTTMVKDQFGESQKTTWEIVQITNYKGEPMKVLNINYNLGDKPSLKYNNLVIKANDQEQDVKQRVIAARLVSAYRRSMADRDASIQTQVNGKIPVYYKLYIVEGKKITVFSPVPLDDQTDEFKAKRAEQRAIHTLWNDPTLIQEV